MVQATALAGDVSDEARVTELVGQVLREAGRVDVLVNNAAIQREGLLVDQTLEDFRAVVDTNLLGTFLCSRAVLPSMLANGLGSSSTCRRSSALSAMPSPAGVLGDQGARSSA